jgi:hypothetical protein
LIESAKVPACSRITWNWPSVSEYLNAVHGIPVRSSASCSIGCSRSAGSQKLGAAKITPSAWRCRTSETSGVPRSPDGS